MALSAVVLVLLSVFILETDSDRAPAAALRFAAPSGGDIIASLPSATACPLSCSRLKVIVTRGERTARITGG